MASSSKAFIATNWNKSGNIYLKLESIYKSGNICCKVTGIPMGTNCAPLLADLFLCSYDNEFLDNMTQVATGGLPGHLIYAIDTLMI